MSNSPMLSFPIEFNANSAFVGKGFQNGLMFESISFYLSFWHYTIIFFFFPSSSSQFSVESSFIPLQYLATSS
jgi:hypothetical protein